MHWSLERLILSEEPEKADILEPAKADGSEEPEKASNNYGACKSCYASRTWTTIREPLQAPCYKNSCCKGLFSSVRGI